MIEDGVGLVSAQRPEHRWWSRIVGGCRICQCAADRKLVLELDCRVVWAGCPLGSLQFFLSL